MANTVLNLTKGATYGVSWLPRHNEFVDFPTVQAVAATTDYFEISLDRADRDCLLLVENTSTGDSGADYDVVIKGGEGNKFSQGDFTFEVKKATKKLIRLDSAKFFKNGKIFIGVENVAVKVALIVAE